MAERCLRFRQIGNVSIVYTMKICDMFVNISSFLFM